MIQRMNNVLIKHSKVLFGIITIVIIISFVWFFTPGADGSLLFSKSSNVIAKIGDVEVTTTDADRAQKSVVLGQAPAIYAAYGDKSVEFLKRMGRMGDDQLRILAATLKLAEIRGFAVADSEIQDALKIEPAFQENGKFSPQKYDAFIKMLETIGFDLEDFENATRDALLLQKFQASAFAGVAVPTDNEVMTDLNPMLFKFTQKNVGFKSEEIKAAIAEPAEEKIRKKYDENPDSYKEPASTATIFYINYKDVKVADLEKKVQDGLTADDRAKLKPEELKKREEGLREYFIGEEAQTLLNDLIKTAREKMSAAETLKVEAEKNGKKLDNAKLAEEMCKKQQEILQEVAKEKGVKLQHASESGITTVTAPSALVDSWLIQNICMIPQVGDFSQIVRNKDSVAIAMLTKRGEPQRLEYAAVKKKIAEELKGAEFKQKIDEAVKKLEAFRNEVAAGKIALDKLEEEAAKHDLKILQTTDASESAAETFHNTYQATLDLQKKLGELYFALQRQDTEKLKELTNGNAAQAEFLFNIMHSSYTQAISFLGELNEWKLGYVSPSRGSEFMVITKAVPAKVTDKLTKSHRAYIYAQKREAASQSWQAWYQKEIMAAISPYVQKKEQPAQQPAE